MANIHFIKDEKTITILQAILDLAGPNFIAPYDAALQPFNANNLNQETLIQYVVPGGTSLQGYSEPSMTESMGSAINSMLTVLAPVISAYGLILPILGVIRGIIEVLCAMMNPFAVVKAIIRLFKKWLPPFISLYPPLAGVIIIISTIKAILAIVFFILTVVLPTLQLIIANIKTLANAFGGDANQQTRDAGKEKLTTMLAELLNQTGVMGALLPLLEIIMLILNLVSGLPCKKGKSRKADCDSSSLVKVKTKHNCDDNDASCCDNKTCPPELRRGAIKGRGTLIPSIFGEAPPFFAYKLHTGNSLVPKLKKYNQSMTDQLNPQLDEEIDEGCPPGGDDDDCPNLRIRIESRRGSSRRVTRAIAKVRGQVITIMSPSLIRMIGAVNYEVLPNYESLVMRNIIGLACHPDVELAKEELAIKYAEIETPIVERFPETADLFDRYSGLNSTFNGLVNDLSNQIQGDGSINGIIGVVNKDPPYDDNIAAIEGIQDSMLNLLNDFANDMIGRLNGIVAKANNRFDSELEVDKNLAKANGQDIATIIVTPRDSTGSLLVQNLPDGVDISVEILTDFGQISNQRRINSTGQILADLKSATPGLATIRAKINSEFISDLTDGVESVVEAEVRFVADAALPQRRLVSTPSAGSKAPTGSNAERETKG
jgi:hypothetical protein